MKGVKHIVKFTEYWLFEQIEGSEDSYYIRIGSTSGGKIKYGWRLGRETVIGDIALFGGDLSQEKQDELEKKFQDWQKEKR